VFLSWKLGLAGGEVERLGISVFRNSFLPLSRLDTKATRQRSYIS